MRSLSTCTAATTASFYFILSTVAVDAFVVVSPSQQQQHQQQLAAAISRTLPLHTSSTTSLAFSLGGGAASSSSSSSDDESSEEPVWRSKNNNKKEDSSSSSFSWWWNLRKLDPRRTRFTTHLNNASPEEAAETEAASSSSSWQTTPSSASSAASPASSSFSSFPRFVSGDGLHRLRQWVLELRDELYQARSLGLQHKARYLEQTIWKAQQRDAEFVYKVNSDRARAAEQSQQQQQHPPSSQQQQQQQQQPWTPSETNSHSSEPQSPQHSSSPLSPESSFSSTQHWRAAQFRRQAEQAREALPQFQLEGLWVGKYGDHGFELINVTYRGDTLIATKVTGDRNVPRGEISFRVDLSQDIASLEPIALDEDAAHQWGTRYLERFQGQGQVAAEGYRNPQWMDGQLILVGDEFISFAWLPINHQVFFGRPSAELTLKLLREAHAKQVCLKENRRTARSRSRSRASSTKTWSPEAARQHIERCWQETELLEEEQLVEDDESPLGIFWSHDQQDYYGQEGCFE